MESRANAAAAVNATTAMRVAADLRRRILLGELAPGQRLKIDELASRCDVSHMPVREALRELEGEGVLEVSPHRGALVRAVDARFVRNLYDLRAAVEGMLTERCAERIDVAGIGELERRVREHERATGEGIDRERLAANRAIHDLINRTGDNPEALRVMEQGKLLVEALRLRFSYSARRLRAIVAEHRALCAAIARHDAAKAGAIARKHCASARDDLLARLAGGSA